MCLRAGCVTARVLACARLFFVVARAVQLLQKKKAEQAAKKREELKALSREEQRKREAKEAKKALKPRMKIKTISG